MSVDRRGLLRLTGSAVGVSLAGCSSNPLAHPMLDLAVDNARPESVQLDVTFLRPDVVERSEAIAFEGHYEIPPREHTDDLWSVEDVVQDRPYRIETQVGPARQSYHYHYQPDCRRDTPYEIGVVINLNLDGGVTFTQTTCSDNERFF